MKGVLKEKIKKIFSKRDFVTISIFNFKRSFMEFFDKCCKEKSCVL